jgi:hypothetical protein
MATVIIVMSTRQQDEDGPMDVRWTIGFWSKGGAFGLQVLLSLEYF